MLPLVAVESASAPAIVEWPAVAERLRQYAAARGQRAAAERCELCDAAIESEHGHVVNVASRTLLCVCRPCYLLFTHDGAGGARFRAVPQRYQLLPELAVSPDGWDALQIPIGLAFFFRNSATGRTTAFYPSPAGATESELPLDAWDAWARSVPALSTLNADVEALLIRRSPSPQSGFGAAIPRSLQGGFGEPKPFPPPSGLGEPSPSSQNGHAASGDTVDALIVPIDACYELVGRIRRAWRGFQGGDDVWREIDEFFARARERARSVEPPQGRAERVDDPGATVV
jgi:hypothetical protein